MERFLASSPPPNCLAIEVRDIHGNIRNRFECEGNGVELIQHPHLGLLSHIQRHGQHGGIIDTTSELWQWQEDQTPAKHCFERPYAFSFDSSGHGLAIDLSWGNERDCRNLILDPRGGTVTIVDCGMTDRIGPIAFPHALGSLNCLKREGEEDFGNSNYRLWRHREVGRFDCLRPWDPPERDFCAVSGVAYAKEMFLGAGPVWNRTAHQNLGYFLEMLELETGRRSVSIHLHGSPTRVALSGDKQTAIVGFAEGGLAFYDLKSQRALSELTLLKNGMPSVPLSLEVKGDKLLIGTHDGRVLLTRLVS